MSQVPPPPPPLPAGWYPHHGEMRYWDGQAWSASTDAPPRGEGQGRSAAFVWSCALAAVAVFAAIAYYIYAYQQAGNCC